MKYIRSPAPPTHSASSDWPTAMLRMDDVVHDYRSWGCLKRRTGQPGKADQLDGRGTLLHMTHTLRNNSHVAY